MRTASIRPFFATATNPGLRRKVAPRRVRPCSCPSAARPLADALQAPLHRSSWAKMRASRKRSASKSGPRIGKQPPMQRCGIGSYRRILLGEHKKKKSVQSINTTCVFGRFACDAREASAPQRTLAVVHQAHPGLSQAWSSALGTTSAHSDLRIRQSAFCADLLEARLLDSEPSSLDTSDSRICR